MKFTLVYTIALVIFSVNGVLSSKNHTRKSNDKGLCDGKTLSNGTQIPQGSCSNTIQGEIPASNKMPSTLIISPKNGEELKANKEFNVDIVVDNLVTGQFSDPDMEYNLVPQKINHHGLIFGHTHVTIQELNGHNPPNSEEFAFFKGVNDKADASGLLTVDVVSEDGKKGLPAGTYRICTMSGAFSHQPVIMPVAKRGAQDDCIRIRVN